MTGPPGPGYVTTGLGSLDMRQRNRYLVRRGRRRQLRERPGRQAGGPDDPRAQGEEAPAPHNEHAEVAVRGHTQAATTRKELP